MELTREKLQEMAAVDIRDVDINSLTDLRDIVVDTKSLSPRSWLHLQRRPITYTSTGSGTIS